MVTFGGALADLRKQRKMTQADLATKAGLARNTISLLERNEGNPTVKTLDNLAYALGVSTAELIRIYDQAQAQGE